MRTAALTTPTFSVKGDRMDTKTTIEHWYGTLRFPHRFNGAFYKTLEAITVPSDLTLDGYDLVSRDGKRNLLAFLYFCENAFHRARAMGIGEDVITDTLKDLVICTEDNSAAMGELYLGQLKWLALHLRLKLFRLGRLQFCMGAAKRDIPAADVLKGDPVLEIHVPRGDKLGIEACRDSLSRAKAFFARFFPDFDYRALICESWLLDSALREYLPENSNILRFGTLFTIVSQTETYDLLGSLFGLNASVENLAEAVCASDFARRIKEAVLSGVRFHTALGFIDREEPR